MQELCAAPDIWAGYWAALLSAGWDDFDAQERGKEETLDVQQYAKNLVKVCKEFGFKQGYKFEQLSYRQVCSDATVL